MGSNRPNQMDSSSQRWPSSREEYPPGDDSRGNDLREVVLETKGGVGSIAKND